MSTIEHREIKQNQTPRSYFDINGFEFRVGEFYDPNKRLNGPKMEIRILKKIDDDLLDEGMAQFEALLDKIKEWVSQTSGEVGSL